MMMERKVRARWLMTKFIILWSMNSILGSRTPLIFCKKESNMIRFVFSITFCVTVFVYVTILSPMYNTTFSSQAKICCTSCGVASTGTMLGTLQQFNRTYFFFFFFTAQTVQNSQRYFVHKLKNISSSSFKFTQPCWLFNIIEQIIPELCFLIL